MVFSGIVAWPPCQNGYAVLLRQSLSHRRDELRRGAGVRRKIFVQQKDMHRIIAVSRSAAAAGSTCQNRLAFRAIAKNEDIHLRPDETVNRFLGAADDGFVVIERSIRAQASGEISKSRMSRQ